MSIYVTYLTTYYGSKLPMFYIGSSDLNKISKNYRGSVLSKKYKNIWNYELKFNPNLFSTKIISRHNTRKEATETEYRLQSKLNVIKSPMYINMAFAAKNGYFGRDVSGELNPNYKNTWTDEMKKHQSNVHATELTKSKFKQSNIRNHGVEFPMQSEIIRNKSKNTLLKKYGVDHISKVVEHRKLVIEKTHRTLEMNKVKRFGFTSTLEFINHLNMIIKIYDLRYLDKDCKKYNKIKLEELCKHFNIYGNGCRASLRKFIIKYKM